MRLPLPQFAASDRDPDRIAEVIETATTEFLAQCLEPEDLNFPVMPPFGSWVKALDEESGNQIMAVVYHATTSPIDSVHRARALGLSLQELREQQPQIFAMLKTEFRAIIVGFISPEPGREGEGEQGSRRGRGGKGAGEAEAGGGKIYQYLPPRPPQIHQAVYRCQQGEIIRFSEQLDFLRSLLQVMGAPIESLIAANIREIYQLRQADRDWLIQAGRTLSVILKDDYDRLRYILSQLHF
ncbi:MAG: hypothetical protein KME17_18610 [Cyanosarcina radialis HA8281-LM2]|jgi:hypothetical protein|nr:hypothetical protein [Cyanosarcina radialis HA8281-LM2]